MAFVAMKKRLALTADGDRDNSGEQSAICDEAQANFFRDHLAWWVPSFATGLRRRAGSGFYAAVADLLAALMPIERQRFNVPAPRSPWNLPSLQSRRMSSRAALAAHCGDKRVAFGWKAAVFRSARRSAYRRIPHLRRSLYAG
jgi:hypothetical protein